MIDWFATLQLIFAFAVAGILFVLSVAKRKPSLLAFVLVAAIEVGLLLQSAISIVLVAGGARAKTDTVEFFAYLFVALVIPVGAVFWAMVERNRWSTMVLAVSAATVAVMIARMQQIWLDF